MHRFRSLGGAAMSKSPWFRCNRAQAKRVRMFCLPYAGGSAGSFMPWQAALGDAVDVCAAQLPGHGSRLLEPPLRSFELLTEQLSAAVLANDDLPYLLVGHSFGALLAFEVARRLQRLGATPPRTLVVSGCESPQTRSTAGRRLHELDDKGLIQALRELNGTPVEVLRDRALIERVLPALRADFEMVANYRFVAGPLLTSPIVVMAGLSDAQVGTGGVEGWGALTQSTHALHWIEGDHFFIDSQRQSVLDVLRPLVR